MQKKVVKRIKINNPLIIKWIILLILIPVFPLKAEDKLAYINQLYQEQKRSEIIQTINQVDKAIDTVVKLPDGARKKFAVLVAIAGKKYDIDPRIMIAIMKVESDFRQHAVSNTGDYSISQINYNVWVKHFKKLDRTPLDLNKLKTSESYAIFRMAEILALLKKQHAKTDPLWFSRYHSSTIKHKDRYTGLLKKEFKKLLIFGPNLLTHLPENPQEIAQICLKESL